MGVEKHIVNVDGQSLINQSINQSSSCGLPIKIVVDRHGLTEEMPLSAPIPRPLSLLVLLRLDSVCLLQGAY